MNILSPANLPPEEMRENLMLVILQPSCKGCRKIETTWIVRIHRKTITGDKTVKLDRQSYVTRRNGQDENGGQDFYGEKNTIAVSKDGNLQKHPRMKKKPQITATNFANASGSGADAAERTQRGYLRRDSSPLGSQ